MRTLFAFFIFIAAAFPQDVWVQKPEDWAKPEVMQVLANGGEINVQGVHTSLALKHRHYTESNQLIINGHNVTTYYGFEGEFKPYDPENPPPRTGTPLAIMDCSYVTIKNMEVWGGGEVAVGLNDSYPEEGGLHHITLENITVRYAATRGVFMGGHRIRDITLKKVVIRETIYDGSPTHGIYLSGGSWEGDEEYGPITNTKIINCVSGATGGRHGLQINGCFEGVEIAWSNFFYNQLSGISLIGVKGCKIHHCRFWGNNRTAIVIYDDFDESYWDPTSPESVAAWKKVHHPNGDIQIVYNTMVVGPTQWQKDNWHNNDPVAFPALQINNSVHCTVKGGEEILYPPGPITIDHNIMVAPKECMIAFSNDHDGLATTVTSNIFHALNGKEPTVSVPGMAYEIQSLEGLKVKRNGEDHILYQGNRMVDPRIAMPIYPLIDMTALDYFDFGPMFNVGMKEMLRCGQIFMGQFYGAEAKIFISKQKAGSTGIKAKAPMRVNKKKKARGK